MQQTEKYKLNLIEPDDPFLPDALNESTRKIEDAMLDHEARMSAENAALDQRVTALEDHDLLVSFYMGDSPSSATQVVHIGFRPRFLLIWSVDLSNKTWIAFLPELGSLCGMISSTEDGFSVRSEINSLNIRYYFFAYR